MYLSCVCVFLYYTVVCVYFYFYKVLFGRKECPFSQIGTLPVFFISRMNTVIAHKIKVKLPSNILTKERIHILLCCDGNCNSYWETFLNSYIKWTINNKEGEHFYFTFFIILLSSIWMPNMRKERYMAAQASSKGL